MTSDIRARQKAEWQILHDRILETLSLLGKEDYLGREDYLLVDDDWGDWRQKLEVQNLNLLQPHVVKGLQSLLQGYPDWDIMFRVSPLGTENIWPAMGLIIRDDVIIDDLKREFLPEEFRNFRYEGSRPSDRIFQL